MRFFVKSVRSETYYPNMKKINKCKTCGACVRLYSIWNVRVSRTKFCYCLIHENIADYCGNCIDWRRRENEYDFSVERFSEVRHDLKIIFDILSE